MTFDGLMAILKDSPSLIPIALFMVAFIEAIVFTAPLMPAVVLFLGMAALQQAAGGSFAVIVIAVAAGTFLGDALSFTIGRVYRDRIGGWWPFKNYPTLLPRSIAWMQRWGVLGVIGSKFFGPLRWLAPTVCGMLRMAPLPFMVANVLGTLLLAGVLLGPPYYGMKTMF